MKDQLEVGDLWLEIPKPLNTTYKGCGVWFVQKVLIIDNKPVYLIKQIHSISGLNEDKFIKLTQKEAFEVNNFWEYKIIKRKRNENL